MGKYLNLDWWTNFLDGWWVTLRYSIPFREEKKQYKSPEETRGTSALDGPPLGSKVYSIIYLTSVAADV